MPGAVAAQNQNNCANCHFANMYESGEVGRSHPYYPFDSFHVFHMSAWERSVHARNFVGCESCHGGNAATLGFGDISPAIPAAQALSSLEAATGQLYLAVLIARLVSLNVAYSIRTNGKGM